mmetsp:Transcript_16427/g.27112  ORF Transcript_16427/g.27112 Transcript_16427/m.27112 type:complete len:739 (+) Transcript_16427:105-2321(+)
MAADQEDPGHYEVDQSGNAFADNVTSGEHVMGGGPLGAGEDDRERIDESGEDMTGNGTMQRMNSNRVGKKRGPYKKRARIVAYSAVLGKEITTIGNELGFDMNRCNILLRKIFVALYIQESGFTRARPLSKIDLPSEVSPALRNEIDTLCERQKNERPFMPLLVYHLTVAISEAGIHPQHPAFFQLLRRVKELLVGDKIVGLTASTLPMPALPVTFGGESLSMWPGSDTQLPIQTVQMIPSPSPVGMPPATPTQLQLTTTGTPSAGMLTSPTYASQSIKRKTHAWTAQLIQYVQNAASALGLDKGSSDSLLEKLKAVLVVAPDTPADNDMRGEDNVEDDGGDEASAGSIGQSSTNAPMSAGGRQRKRGPYRKRLRLKPWSGQVQRDIMSAAFDIGIDAVRAGMLIQSLQEFLSPSSSPSLLGPPPMAIEVPHIDHVVIPPQQLDPQPPVIHHVMQAAGQMGLDACTIQALAQRVRESLIESSYKNTTSTTPPPVAGPTTPVVPRPSLDAAQRGEWYTGPDGKVHKKRGPYRKKAKTSLSGEEGGSPNGPSTPAQTSPSPSQGTLQMMTFSAPMASPSSAHSFASPQPAMLNYQHSSVGMREETVPGDYYDDGSGKGFQQQNQSREEVPTYDDGNGKGFQQISREEVPTFQRRKRGSYSTKRRYMDHPHDPDVSVEIANSEDSGSETQDVMNPSEQEQGGLEDGNMQQTMQSFTSFSHDTISHDTISQDTSHDTTAMGN